MSQLRRQSAPSPFVPSPIKGPAQQVRLAILEGITSGRLRSGDRLPSELEQAQGFKVSRAVIREALRSLAQLGLITTVQGRGGGSFVNHLEHGPVQHHLQEAMGLLLDFDEINLAELVDARRALEGTAARLGATRRGEGELAAMAEAINRSRNDTLAADAWLELDIHFHRAVVSFSTEAGTRPACWQFASNATRGTAARCGCCPVPVDTVPRPSARYRPRRFSSSRAGRGPAGSHRSQTPLGSRSPRPGPKSSRRQILNGECTPAWAAIRSVVRPAGQGLIPFDLSQLTTPFTHDGMTR